MLISVRQGVGTDHHQRVRQCHLQAAHAHCALSGHSVQLWRSSSTDWWPGGVRRPLFKRERTIGVLCPLSLSHTHKHKQANIYFVFAFTSIICSRSHQKNTGLYFPFNLRLKASGAWQVRGKHEVHCEISGIPTDTPREYQIMVSNPLHMWRYTAGLSITGRTDPYE